MKYNVIFPQNYNKGQQKDWPLILFLHGASERGNNITILKKHGPPKVAKKMKLPFVILAPQCDHEEYWETKKVIKLLDLAIEQHSVNPKKVYLTGLSMGGFGTWQVASHYSERFAAIAPVCGGGTKQIANNLVNMPIWIFHGEKDDIIPVTKSIEMAEALERAGNKVKLTIYPNVGHDSWTQTYHNPELYDWFQKFELK